MPLKDFIQQKKNSGSLNNFISANQQTTSTGGLKAFLGNTTQTTKPIQAKQTIVSDVKKAAGNATKTAGDVFNTVGKVLGVAQGVASLELKALTQGVADLLTPAFGKGNLKQATDNALKHFVDTQKRVPEVITLNKTYSPSQLVKETQGNQKQTPVQHAVQLTLGITSDLILDPMWYFKPAKAISKLGEVTHLGEPISKISQTVSKSKIVQGLNKMFTSTSGNKEVDAIVTKFRDLAQYQKGELLNQAISIQKRIAKAGGETAAQIVKGLESPETLKTANSTAVKIAEELRGTYKNFLDKANSVGLNIGEIMDYAPHIRTKESFLKTIKDTVGIGVKEWGTANVQKGRKLTGTIEELQRAGIDIFEKNPAIQLARKGEAYVKAITSTEFANQMKKFATKDGVSVTNTLFKDLKFEPGVARVIDNYYQRIKPEELNVIVKGFDSIQNWWKSQALISPQYHIRNVIGNLWNNYLAGVNPLKYQEATMLQKGIIKNPDLMTEMKKLGVINEGWYAADMTSAIEDTVKSTSTILKKLNPLNRDNYLANLNKTIGSALENNSRIAHYLSMVEKGMTKEEAAASVRKFLFDYTELSKTEQNIFKRVVPFYTWTRKNIPLQLSELVSNPGKFTVPYKVKNEIESGVTVPNEKYMSPYIKENVPVRIRTNKDGNTEYFLLGNWLPYAQALDFLSQPTENIMSSISPLFKIPYEFYSNKSLFFKDTFGQPQDIESTYKKQTEFLGQSMPAKWVNLLKNIRLLSDINKWVDKKDPTEVVDSWQVKFLNLFFGRAATYDVRKSKYFYDQDTTKRVSDLKAAIKAAEKNQDKKSADKLRQELQDTLKSRNAP